MKTFAITDYGIYIYGARQWGTENMADKQRSGNEITWYDPRFWVAILVLLVSIVGVFVLAVIALSRSTDSASAERVLAVILPLLGTWVGTVLAYYFSRENFESATQSVRRMADSLTSIEKLESIRAELKQIPTSDINPLLRITSKKPIDKIKLIKDIRILFEQSEQNRLPVLDENGHPLYMIHRSIIDRYLTQKTTVDDLNTQQLNDLTLKKLLDDDAGLRNIFETSFVTVAKHDTLADAKRKMELTPNCSDVFVTADGTKNSSVLGWLTNWIISESAHV